MTAPEATQTFAPGDPATWIHVPRGGYGYPINVPVVVLKVTQKRVLVVAPLRNGGSKEVWVWPKSLKERGC